MKAPKKRRLWTQEEEQRLRASWQEYGYRGLRAQFPDRTWAAIYQKAEVMKLPFGIPQGHVSLSEAARICGVYVPTLRRILAARSVLVRSCYPEPPRSKRSVAKNDNAKPFTQKREFIDPDDARDAMEWWLGTETPLAASKRTGVGASTLWTWLVQANQITKTETGSRKAHRVDPAVVDAIVAQHRARRPARVYRRAA